MKYVASLPEITLPLRVSITPTHIAKGKRCDAKGDPIFLALRAKLPPDVNIVVSNLAVQFAVTKRHCLEVLWVPLPPEAKVFVARFDTKRLVFPFELELCQPNS